MEDLVRLRQVPAGAQLLSAVRLARRIRRRQPVALHQRARARQHPEGRHLLGGAAHVGRPDQRRRSCAPSPTWSTSIDIPTVKVTGGQRIDLLGVKKDDLPAVWADLNAAGMVSGHAYAKGAAHGEDLRRHRLVPLRHPGFDRTGHQAREVHVGLVDAGQGQDGGVRLPAQLRRGDLQGHRRDLRRVRLRHPLRRRRRPRHQGHRSAGPRRHRGRGDRDDRGALCQLYREQGRYLERIYKWAKRVGVDTIRQQIMEDGERRTRALRALRAIAQKFAQIDPWAERAAGKDAHEFAPLADLTPCSGGRRVTAIASLDRDRRARGHPARGARVVQDARAATSRCSAPPTTRCSRSTIAARTRAGR